MGYWIFRALTIVLLKLLFRVKVEGLQNIPNKSNFIVASNHGSFLDAWIIGAAMPKKVYWIALRSFYHSSWFPRWFLRRVDALAHGGSSSKSVALLTGNKNIGLFPEGTRTHDGALREFKRGAALLAYKTGRPVVPCAILGSYEALPRRRNLPKLFAPIKLKIGKPIYLPKRFEDKIEDTRLQEGIFRIRNVIKEMLDAE